MHKKPRPPGLGREALVLAAHQYRFALKLIIRRTANACGQSLETADVEDLLQETYLALWQGGEVAEPAAANGYASRTARNTTLDALRAWQTRKRGGGQLAELPDVDDLASHEPTPEARSIARAMLADSLTAARRCLGRRAFAPFYLTCVLGLTGAEAGDRLGLTQSAVDSTVHRARRRLAAEGLTLRRRPT